MTNIPDYEGSRKIVLLVLKALNSFFYINVFKKENVLYAELKNVRNFISLTLN